MTTAAFVASSEGTVDGLVDGNIAYIIILHTFPILFSWFDCFVLPFVQCAF